MARAIRPSKKTTKNELGSPVQAEGVETRTGARKATKPQRAWLARGLDQPGGKLPLFEEDGRRVNQALIRSCLEHGWAERWFDNPLKPDWLICRLTNAGRDLLEAAER